MTSAALCDLPHIEREIAQSQGGLGSTRLSTSVVSARAAPFALALRLAALRLKPSLARCCSRLRRPARALARQAARDSLAQPFERELAVSRLRACVLRHRGDAGA